MTVKFIMRRHDRQNYEEQNINDIISIINDPIIQEAFHDSIERIQVHGPVHRTQFTSDNPEQYFWIRFSVHDKDGQIIPGYGGVHVFLCFQVFLWNGNGYRQGNCIVPNPYPDQPDIADVSNYFGYWKPVRFTLSVQKVFQHTVSPASYIPRKRQPISIVDPKTGKKISN